MGTQQLLQIVLGVIVIAIGVVVGINIFDANAQESSKDAITEDCLLLASAAQGYYYKPAYMGGGDNSFENIAIADCGMNAAGNEQTGENTNAIYVITGSGSLFTVSATSNSGDERTVVLTCDMSQPGDNRISISYKSW
ncbi:MAG: hypothetical protein JXA28_06665 [Bacteroidetes bacterium]|nr:hypothetical protein [Bacteroidota bacterium]